MTELEKYRDNPVARDIELFRASGAIELLHNLKEDWAEGEEVENLAVIDHIQEGIPQASLIFKYDDYRFYYTKFRSDWENWKSPLEAGRQISETTLSISSRTIEDDELPTAVMQTTVSSRLLPDIKEDSGHLLLMRQQEPKLYNKRSVEEKVYVYAVIDEGEVFNRISKFLQNDLSIRQQLGITPKGIKDLQSTDSTFQKVYSQPFGELVYLPENIGIRV